jgi:RNA polymerase sigma factor (sigma-70 family)
MSRGPAGAIVQYLRQAVGAPAADGPGDADLLGRYAGTGEPAAFAELVRRHGPLVWRVCRRILGHEQDAEDAFQATFLVLARKARSVRNREAVAGYLYAVAYRVARRARQAAARRSAHERRAPAALGPPAVAEAAVRELQAILDEEVSRLPARHRAPFVLCCLEGRGKAEVARELGWKEGTVSSRLDQARKRLRRRLARRGVALSAALATVALAEDAAAAVPAPLAAATAALAQRGAVLSPEVTALVQGVLRSMFLTKLRIVMGVLLLAVGAGVGVGALRSSAGDPPPPPAPAAPRTPPRAKGDDGEALRTRAGALLREALEALDAGEDPLRCRAVAEVGVVQAEAGDRQAARHTLDRARELVDALPENQQRPEQRNLARAYARAGETSQLVALVESIPGPPPDADTKEESFADMVLRECAEELAQARQGPAALRLVERISRAEGRDWARASVLTDLAIAQARAGKVEEARRMVGRIATPDAKVAALAGAGAANQSWFDYPLRPGIALVLLRAGDRAGAKEAAQRALRIARQVEGDPARGQALAAVACVQARLGDFDAALETARDVHPEPWKSHALVAIARARAAQGPGKEAREMIDRLADPQMRVHGLYQLALGQAAAGDRRAARASFRLAADLIPSLTENERSLEQSGALHNLATAQAAAGEFEAALQTARSIPGNAGLTFVNIAAEQARAGDAVGACRTVDTFVPNDVYWHARALEEVARSRTKRGDERGATRWARGLTVADDRGHALLGVAEGLVDHGKDR